MAKNKRKQSGQADAQQNYSNSQSGSTANTSDKNEYTDKLTNPSQYSYEDDRERRDGPGGE